MSETYSVWPPKRLPRLRWRQDQQFVLLEIPSGWSWGRYLFEVKAAMNRHKDFLALNENIPAGERNAFIQSAENAKILGTIQ